ncbi:MAG: hypothetical protein RIR00_434 [Pseudomonadota bacterium]|jgi:general secretion pathway protein F
MRFELQVYRDGEGLSQIELEAQNAAEAETQAGSRGWLVLRVKPLREGGLLSASRRRNRFPLLQFSQQLFGLLRAGLSLLEGLETLAEKEPQASARAVLQTLLDRLRHGHSLSQALAASPESFPPFYVASLRASEQSGDVAEALRRYIGYQKQLDQLRKQVVSALIYPCLLLGVGTLVVLFLLGYVVPRFSSIYQSRSDTLPWASRLLLDWGEFVSGHPLALAGLVFGSVAALLTLLRQPAFQRRLADQLWQLPWLGERLRTYQLSRLFRTLGMLLHGGTPLVGALELVPGLLSPLLQPLLAVATARIREGEALSRAFLEAGLTTPVAFRMLRVGERSGQMAEMLDNIAVFYDEEIERDIGIFTRVFEPLMMALIGLLVGGIVIVMYMPIFDLAGSLQ